MGLARTLEISDGVRPATCLAPLRSPQSGSGDPHTHVAVACCIHSGTRSSTSCGSLPLVCAYNEPRRGPSQRLTDRDTETFANYVPECTDNSTECVVQRRPAPEVRSEVDRLPDISISSQLRPVMNGAMCFSMAEATA
jgi:hypothetical protein